MQKATSRYHREFKQCLLQLRIASTNGILLHLADDVVFTFFQHFDSLDAQSLLRFRQLFVL